jgi:hypothetical protein
MGIDFGKILEVAARTAGAAVTGGASEAAIAGAKAATKPAAKKQQPKNEWVTMTYPDGHSELVPGPGMDPEKANVWAQQKLANETDKANRDFITNTVLPRLPQVDASAGIADAIDQDAWVQQRDLGEGARGALDANLQDQRNNATWTNNQSGNMYGSYKGEMSALNDSDRSALDRYNAETDPLMQRREAQGWGADVQNDPEGLAAQRAALGQLSGMAGGSLDYSASQYASNPGDIARQTQAYDTFGGIYGGSLDYQSQGAQAYADQATIDGQWDVYGQLQGAAGGSLDTVSQAAQAAASAKSVGQHEKAVDDLGGLVNGGEWADSQRDVRDKYKALTSPEVTGQERFIMELARRQREAEASAQRGAIAQDQSLRGVRSGAAETADMLAQGQQSSQDRVLADLGMQANAVDRSMQALQGYGQATNAGRAAQLQAQGMYTDATGNLRSQEFDEAFKRAAAGDAMAVANADRKLQAMGMSADQINNMREQSFNEAYSRGIAADNAAANNQATRLGGAQGMASQANAIRAANDAVGTFNVGQQNTAKANNQTTRLGAAGMQSDAANQLRSANDAISTFNKTGSQIAQRHQDDYAQRESERIGGVANDRLTGTQNTNAGIGSRLGEVHTAGQDHLDQGYDRNQDTIAATDTTIKSKYGIGQDTIGAATRYGNNQHARAMGGLGAATNVAELAQLATKQALAELNKESFNVLDPSTW